MTWQEYQDAVGELYDQAEGIGIVRRNITLPDKVTGQARQIDVWIEIQSKGHKLGILIDAKFRKDRVDVKDIEEVLALASAVGANSSVLVALNGWTDPAAEKAAFCGLDLRLLTMEEALELIVPDKWMMCPYCAKDCIVADRQGGMVIDGLWSLLVAGQCRHCKAALIWCWECGSNIIVEPDSEYECGCERVWNNTADGISVKLVDSEQWIPLVDNDEIMEDFALDFTEPNDPTFVSAKFYIRRGIAHRERGQVNAAINDFSQALQLMPQSGLAYYHRAYTFDMAECSEQALHDYSKAIELEPHQAVAYGSRGGMYYSQERYREARIDFHKFLDLMPDSPDKSTIQTAIAHCEFEEARD